MLKSSIKRDIKGQRFGRLVVTELIGRRHNRTYWRCQCDCGNVCEAPVNMLVKGEKVSCGCKNAENRNNLKYYDRGIVDGTMISAVNGLRKTNKNNSSGITGVSFDRTKGK